MKFKRWKLILYSIVSVVFLFCSCTGFYASAADGGNNGEAYDDPFGDSGIETSFENVGYYDVYIPYKLSLGDIGGYATSALTTGQYYFQGDSTVPKINEIMYPKVNLEFNKSGATMWGSTVKMDSKLGLNYIEINGTTFYIAAFPLGLFNYSGIDSMSSYAGRGANIGGAMANGFLLDVILTDNTVLHFIMGDAVGWVHSNADPAEDLHDASSAQDGIAYQRAALKLPQYSRFFHCDNPYHVIELWCSGVEGFYDAYLTGRSIAYIRVYDATANAKNFKVKHGFEKVVTGGVKGGKSISNNNSSKADAASSIGMCITGFKLMEESNFVSGHAINESAIALPDISELQYIDREQLVSWADNISYAKDERYYTTPIKVFLFVGIIMTIWSILLYIAYWFDRINNFIELQLLPILTLGILQVSPDDKTSNYNDKNMSRKVIVHKDIVAVTLIGVSVGILLISGRANTLANLLINTFNSIF